MWITASVNDLLAKKRLSNRLPSFFLDDVKNLQKTGNVTMTAVKKSEVFQTVRNETARTLAGEGIEMFSSASVSMTTSLLEGAETGAYSSASTRVDLPAPASGRVSDQFSEGS